MRESVLSAAQSLADYVLSQDHEYDNYMEYCRETSENPLLLEVDHIYIDACVIMYEGNMDVWRKEHFTDEAITLENRAECMICSHRFANSNSELYQELVNDIKTHIEELEDESDTKGREKYKELLTALENSSK